IVTQPPAAQPGAKLSLQQCRSWLRQPRLWAVAAAAIALLAGLAALGLGGWGFKPAVAAEPPKGAVKAGDDRTARPENAHLEIGTVALFSSGVGYFQREGTVEGNATCDLTFRVEDINDLLKSMVLRDLNGGAITAVSYDSHDPVDKTLQSFAIDLSRNRSFGQILNQARGQKVEVVLTQSAAGQPGTISGSIVGVEQQKVPAGKDGTVEVEQLNLKCAEGLRWVRLSDVQRVRFLNPILDSELNQALDVVPLSHDVARRGVRVSFTGDGKREVRVGYVVESPVWKTSYRLVLNKEGKPFLQGWAVVENTSDEDWKDVRMSLISGRPISFKMDLYDPLYAERPV